LPKIIPSLTDLGGALESSRMNTTELKSIQLSLLRDFILRNHVRFNLVDEATEKELEIHEIEEPSYGRRRP
jgi:hypothetical protein